MINELGISRLGVIEEATVELDQGLTVLTGETGAGKTMIMSSISLLLGQRADPGIVRVGAENARVEGRIRPSEHQNRLIADTPAELEDEELLVARQVSAKGRSRTWLGGAQVPATTCAEVMEAGVTICGQSEQVRLTSSDRQRRMLDRAAGKAVATPLASYVEKFATRRRLDAELSELLTAEQSRAREIDMISFGLTEIEQVAPTPGEDEALHAEATRLQDTDDLRAAAQQAVGALAGDEDDPSSGALAALSITRRALADLAARDQEAAAMLADADQAAILLDDLAASVSGYLDRLEADPARLEAIAARRSALAGLTRKYGRTVDEVIEWSRQAAIRLGVLEGSDERIGTLRTELASLDEELQRLATRITKARRKAAATFAAAVTSELAALAMPRATLTFEVSATDELGPYGGDRVELLFTANPGSTPRPIGKVASGGELSRVRLALEVVLAAGKADQTYVFDEVDAGVGGAVGVEIGRRLQQLARTSQVVVVTHLAQVAAFADRHLVVEKSDDGQVTTSGVREVAGADRAEELARMMAGIDTTDNALAHARELLAEAG
ncbi:DNA repair protein RecN [Propionibacteriaceae bacterium Y1700]|uniref:DNA repair protein RecN n=1 Tax=Microlunatus sp. Y1700 TaxID=3418487 RepID=UPI003B80FBB7